MEKSLSKDLKESLKRHIELLGYDPKKGKSSLTEVRRHTYLEEDAYTDYADDENKSDEGEDNADFDFGADEGGKEGGDAEGGDNVDFDFGGGDAEGGDTEEVDEFGTADEFSAADELEGSSDDVEEIDVTDIVKRADDAKGYAEKAVTAAEEGKNMIKDLMGKFEALQQSLSKIDTVSTEVSSIKKDLQAQKPKEKLELRSLDSYPFNVKLTDYWNDVNGKDNYEITDGSTPDAQSPDGEVKVWKLDPDEAKDYSGVDIKKSFIPESRSKKKVLTENRVLDKIKEIITQIGGNVKTFKQIFNTLKVNNVTDLDKAINLVRSNLGYDIDANQTKEVYNNLNSKLGLSLTESAFTKSGYFKILTLAIAIMIGFEISRQSRTETLTIRVKDKDITTVSTGKSTESKYLIFTDDEVFEESDEMFRGKFNSSDVYNELEVGSVYRVKVIGFRIPFLSMYRNIIEVEEDCKDPNNCFPLPHYHKMKSQ